MIRVFIFHRDLERLQYLHQIVTSYFQREQHTYHLMSCCNYSDAVTYVKDLGKKDDIFFFDFSDFRNAFSLAGFLREHNSHASWVYTDGSVEGLYRALIMRPSAYIEHTDNGQAVIAAVKRLEQYHLLLEKKCYFCFKCDGEYRRLSFDEINYFESNAKKVMLCVTGSDKRYYFAARLDQIAEQLPSNFIRCHQSYLVNMHMIRQFDAKNHVFWLQSNEEIPISRRAYKETKERYEMFLDER